MKSVFEDILVIALGIFGTLIVVPNFKKILDRKAFFSNINTAKIIRIIVCLAYIALAIYMKYNVKNTPNETSYLLLFILLGAILSFISFKLYKSYPDKEKSS